MILCIGREFGSGGHEIGKRIAQNLNLSFYDQELVEKAVEKHGLPEDIRHTDEKKTNPWLHKVWYESKDKNLRGLSTNEILFRSQSDVITELADKGDCIFVGRCADYVLDQSGQRNYKIFISAPLEDRIQRIMKLHDMDQKSALTLIQKTDAQRKQYYEHYTGRHWGKPATYDFCINSSTLGIDETAKALSFLLKTYYGHFS